MPLAENYRRLIRLSGSFSSLRASSSSSWLDYLFGKWQETP